MEMIETSKKNTIDSYKMSKVFPVSKQTFSLLQMKPFVMQWQFGCGSHLYMELILKGCNSASN